MANGFQGPPAVDFYSQLSGLGDVLAANRAAQAKKDAFAQATMPGADGQIDYGKAILGLAQVDPQAAALFAQRQNHADTLKQQERDFAFRQTEAQRAQGNADRSYGLQKRTADRADDPTPAGFQKSAAGGLEPIPGGPADTGYLAKKTGITAVPEGFQRSASGGLEPIPGGPNDPAYLRLKGDRQNAPSGYQWNDPNNPSAGMTAIPGGPGEKVDAEVAGRLGLAKSFLGQLPEIRKRIDAGEATGPIDGLLGKAGYGGPGELRRQIDSGAEALLRMLTGAGMNKEEAAEYTRRYKMHPLDSAETLKSKMGQLEQELNSVGETVGKGRGGWSPPAAKTESAKQDPQGFRAPPRLGELRDGYRFKGGNPGDPASWVRQQ